MRIVDRDLEIFRQLSRYRFLRSRHLLALVGGKDTIHFLQRLKALVDAGYLNRPEQQRIYHGFKNRTIVYELTDKARDLIEPIESIVLIWRGSKSTKEFPHSVMVCDILANIEIGVNAAGGRLITWSEILARAPEKTRGEHYPFKLPVSISVRLNGKTYKSDQPIIPDAIFGIEAKNGDVTFYALEADRATEPITRSNLRQTSYMKKALQYEHFIKQETYKKRLGLANFRILNVTTTKENADGILKLLEKNSYMLVQTHPSIPSPSPAADGYLFTQPYLRAGHEPAYINI